MQYFRIDYKESSHIGSEDLQIEDFVKLINFEIFDDRDIAIGSGHFIIINFEEFNNCVDEVDFSLLDLLDYNGQTLNFFEEISLEKLFINNFYDLEYCKSFFRKKFKDYFMAKNCIGYLDTIEIKEDYKGLNIGSRVLKNLRDKFIYDIDYIAVKPYPLEFKTIPNDKFSKEDFDLKKQKIVNFYKKNGYKQLAKSDYYILIF